MKNRTPDEYKINKIRQTTSATQLTTENTSRRKVHSIDTELFMQ